MSDDSVFLSGLAAAFALDPDLVVPEAGLWDDNGAASADAWRWEISSCGGCTPAVYRCHDGFKSDSSGTHFCICQGLVVCNGALWDPC